MDVIEIVDKKLCVIGGEIYSNVLVVAPRIVGNVGEFEKVQSEEFTVGELIADSLVVTDLKVKGTFTQVNEQKLNIATIGDSVDDTLLVKSTIQSDPNDRVFFRFKNFDGKILQIQSIAPGYFDLVSDVDIELKPAHMVWIGAKGEYSRDLLFGKDGMGNIGSEFDGGRPNSVYVKSLVKVGDSVKVSWDATVGAEKGIIETTAGDIVLNPASDYIRGKADYFAISNVGDSGAIDIMPDTVNRDVYLTVERNDDYQRIFLKVNAGGPNRCFSIYKSGDTDYIELVHTTFGLLRMGLDRGGLPSVTLESSSGNLYLNTIGLNTDIVLQPARYVRISNRSLIWYSDGGGDIGNVGSNRPNNIYAKSLVQVGNSLKFNWDATIGAEKGIIETTAGDIVFNPYNEIKCSNKNISDVNNANMNGVMRATTAVATGSTVALPPADESHEGEIRIVLGGAGARDRMYVCLKSDTGNFSWVEIANGGE